MKLFRSFTIAAFAALLFAAPAGAASPARALQGKFAASSDYQEPLCVSHASLCADPVDQVGDEYVGHDEPSLLFKSGIPGSGNDVKYTLRLPKDPKQFPTNNGGPGTPTWNFQLRATFWFGMTMCDTESAPEFTKTCTPDSDANNLTGTDPSAPDYIGKHPGTAYMELQFYPPGFVEQFEGFGCTATQYCAAMTIDSRTADSNHAGPNGKAIENTAACNQYVLGGGEPVNWAYVTKSGKSQAPANPLFTGTFSNPNFAAVNPDTAKDLMMNPGDTVVLRMHDTAAGFRVDMHDLTTGQTGSMTASTANGFGHILYTPNANTCSMQPYAFHPEYSTANTRGTTWSVHTYNVAFSDEIGHFENCRQIDAQANCAVPGFQDPTLDFDDGQNFCVPAADSTLVPINGCLAADSDWDSQSYRPDWPGTDPNVAKDQRLHPQPVMFSSPLANRTQQFSTVAFETDLPRLEASDSQDSPPFCNLIMGTNCPNPPHGAQFYPIYTTAVTSGTGCVWQMGGDFLPNTVNDFGGTSKAEYGPLLQAVYPGPPWSARLRYENFNSGDLTNPCPATKRAGT